MARFFSVETAKSSGLIPKPWHEYFPEKCTHCGADMVISDSRTIYKCGNPHCTRRVAGMIAGIIRDIGLKGYGIQSAYNYIRATNTKSLVEFLKSPPPELRFLPQDISAMNWTYAKLVQCMHIPQLGSKANIVFAGCNNLGDFVNAAEKNGGVLEYLHKLLGGSELPNQVLDIILDYADDLDEITEVVKVVPAARKIVKIAMTGEVSNVKAADGRRITKDQFINILNDIVRPAGVIFERSEAVESVPMIVADRETTHRKYLVGKRRGNLVTSDVLLAMSKQIIEEFYTDLVTSEKEEYTNHFGGAQ